MGSVLTVGLTLTPSHKSKGLEYRAKDRSRGLRLMIYWVAVTGLKLSYHNGYI